MILASSKKPNTKTRDDFFKMIWHAYLKLAKKPKAPVKK